MIVNWTTKIPEISGNYLIKKNSKISVMFITVKDLEIQENDSSYLGDIDYWSQEEIEENYEN